MSAERRADLPPEMGTRVLHDVPMSKHTSWHVGGPADLFFTPRDVMDAAAFVLQLPAHPRRRDLYSRSLG